MQSSFPSSARTTRSLRIESSPCGRFESFDYRGNHFQIDWDEIAPPGAEGEDEEGIPHEQVMEEMRLYIEELSAVHSTAKP